MSEQLYEALDACLQAMDEGATLEKCLGMYPELVDELRPTLEAAYAARSLAEIDVPVEAMNRSRTRLLGKAAALRNGKQPKRAWAGIPRLAFSIFLAVALFIVTSGSFLAASAKSLPGDKLYPVKRAVEDLRVQLSSGEVHQYEVESEYRQLRIEEVQDLLAMQQQRDISYSGVVEEMAGEYWLVSGIAVRVTNDTVMIGEISAGMLVEVEGSTEPDGYVLAQEIHLQEYQFSGTVEEIKDSEWVISGVALKIVSGTQIGPDIRVGDAVLVLARSEDDAVWKAMAILSLEARDATPIPTSGGVGQELETETPESEDHSGAENDEEAPEAAASEVIESSEAEGTPEADKSDEDSSSNEDESTPDVKEVDEISDTGSSSATEEHQESDQSETTDVPEESDSAQEDDAESEVTPTPEG